MIELSFAFAFAFLILALVVLPIRSPAANMVGIIASLVSVTLFFFTLNSSVIYSTVDPCEYAYTYDVSSNSWILSEKICKSNETMIAYVKIASSAPFGWFSIVVAILHAVILTVYALRRGEVE